MRKDKQAQRENNFHMLRERHGYYRMKKIIVIGGGASGMMAAITAARHGAAVTILEHKERIGKNILMTGNGKCNLSNLSFSNDNYYTDTPELLEEVFAEFSEKDTISFFEGLGLLIKNKNGYLYPMSEQASSVLDLLRFEINRRKIQVVTECEVQKINQKQSNKELFEVITNQGTYLSQAVILACGSKASPQSGSDGSGYAFAKQLGHHIVKPLPALVQLRCQETYFKAVAGVRCEANVRLMVDEKFQKEEAGELQLTEYGISGIPVFQLSRIAAKALDTKKKVLAEIDLMPKFSTEEIENFLTKSNENTNKSLQEAMLGIMNKKLLFLMFKINDVKADDLWNTYSSTQAGLHRIRKMIETIKCWQVTVTATNPYANAQVCCGGVDGKELTGKLESKKINGLFFAGEIIDVDGICGGYNLQWAWSSGYVAGKYAARD